MKKLLLINKQNPSDSKYIPKNTIGSYLLGRRISNYILIGIFDDEEIIIDVINNVEEMRCNSIQNYINSIFDSH